MALLLLALQLLAGLTLSEGDMDIKWTPGDDGPAPLPYSRKQHEAMGIKEEDLPSWYKTDAEAAGMSEEEYYGAMSPASMVGKLSPDAQRLLLILCVALGLLCVCVFGNGGLSTFFSSKPGLSSEERADERQQEEAREARMRRFQAISNGLPEKPTYQEMMDAAMGKVPADNDDKDKDQ